MSHVPTVRPSLHIAGCLFLTLLFVTCKKSSTESTITVAGVTTTEASVIGRTSALLGGKVNSTGGAPVTERGVCYSTHTRPTVTDGKTAMGTDLGTFVSNVINLTVSTTYYARAYAINSAGVAYGNEISFTTAPLSVPFVSTDGTVTTNTPNSAIAGGYAFDDGGHPILEKGICWSMAHTPTTADNKTTLAGGTGLYTSPMPALTNNTTYYIRAYATNILGTGYGTTTTIVLDVEGTVYNSVKIGTRLWTMENLKTGTYNDGMAIPYVSANATWGISTAATPMYSWYNNDITNKLVYGGIYNWPAVNTGKLAPMGWHVPTLTDMKELLYALDSTTTETNEPYMGTTITSMRAPLAGGYLKEAGTAHWAAPNTAATNASKFTALPGGWRQSTGGQFDYITIGAGFWSSTPITGDIMYRILLTNSYGGALLDWNGIKQGQSVRCVKD